MATEQQSQLQLQPIALFLVYRAVLLLGRVLTYSTRHFEHGPYFEAFKLRDLARVVLPGGVPRSLYAFKVVLVATVTALVVVYQHATKDNTKNNKKHRKWIKDQVLLPLLMTLLVSSALQTTALLLFGHNTCAAPPHNLADFVLLLLASSAALIASIKMVQEDKNKTATSTTQHSTKDAAAGAALTGAWFLLYMVVFMAAYAVERGTLAGMYMLLRDKVSSASAGVLTYLLALTPKWSMHTMIACHVLPPFLLAALAALLYVAGYTSTLQAQKKAMLSEKKREAHSERRTVHTLMSGLVLSLTLLGAVISYAYVHCA